MAGAQYIIKKSGLRSKKQIGHVFFDEEIQLEDQHWHQRPYVRGVNLEEYLCANRIQPESILRLLLEALEKLKRVHDLGLNHGRVHANNLILSAYDHSVIWVDHNGKGKPQRDIKQCIKSFENLLEPNDYNTRCIIAKLYHSESPLDELQNRAKHKQWLSFEDRRDYLLSEGKVFTTTQAANVEGAEPVLERQREPSESAKALWKKIFSEEADLQKAARQFRELHRERDFFLDIAEGIILGRLPATSKENFLKLWKNGDPQKKRLAEQALLLAERVCDLEREMDALESKGWYEKTFGAQRLMRDTLREECAQALLERDKVLAQRYAQDTPPRLTNLPTRIIPDKIDPNWELGLTEKQLTLDDVVWSFRNIPPGWSDENWVPGNMWISTAMVSQRAYEKVIGNNPSQHVGDEFPVHHVSYAQALFFCNRLSELLELEPCYYSSDDRWNINREANGVRLLKVHEWRYIADAAKELDDKELLEQEWCMENSNATLQKRKSRTINNWGFWDMRGNLEEWVWSDRESESCRIGGSWYHDIEMLRQDKVRYGRVDIATDTIGFRIVASDDVMRLLGSKVMDNNG